MPKEKEKDDELVKIIESLTAIAVALRRVTKQILNYSLKVQREKTGGDGGVSTSKS